MKALALLDSRLALQAQWKVLSQLAQGVHTPMALMVLNVDRFKRVNDLLGYEAGDQIMARMAERLRHFMDHQAHDAARGVWLAPLSGNDMALMLQLDTVALRQPDWVNPLLAHLSMPIGLGEHRFVFSVSAGMAQMGLHEAPFDTLLSAADTAMRQVKSRGGNGFEMDHALPMDPRLPASDHNLILALEGRQFHPYFQPKVCAETGQIVGFEALLRWVHPQRGIIPLKDFFPRLQNSSLMIAVGLQIFEQVVQTQLQWRSLGCELPISFNVSNAELLSTPFRQDLFRMVREAGLPAQAIGLEITETVLADLGPAGEGIVQELRDHGFQLSMDDFGVGTSSLSRLKNIPLSEIKVDRSFIVGIVDSTRNLDLLRGIVNLGKSLGLKVVLEGVETPQEHELACTLGDLMIQGFYYSQAVDPESALVLAQKQPYTVH